MCFVKSGWVVIIIMPRNSNDDRARRATATATTTRKKNKTKTKQSDGKRYVIVDADMLQLPDQVDSGCCTGCCTGFCKCTGRGLWSCTKTFCAPLGSALKCFIVPILVIVILIVAIYFLLEGVGDEVPFVKKWMNETIF